MFLLQSVSIISSDLSYEFLHIDGVNNKIAFLAASLIIELSFFPSSEILPAVMPTPLLPHSTYHNVYSAVDTGAEKRESMPALFFVPRSSPDRIDLHLTCLSELSASLLVLGVVELCFGLVNWGYL